MTHDVLPHALDALDAVLTENHPTKRDTWQDHTVLFHLTRAASHLMHARQYLASGIDPAEEVAGHDYPTHLHHALTRMAMAVELQARGAR